MKLNLHPIMLAGIGVAALGLACSPADILGPTPTPTATSTPIPTATPTPTATPVPTDTPLPTETPLPAEPQTFLLLEDLPSGFEQVPPEEFGLVEGQEFAEGISIGNAFAFVEPDLFEVVFGFTLPLETRLDQIGFDASLDRPEILTEGLVQGMGTAEYEDLGILEGIDQVGDKSNGIGLVLFIDPVAFQLELVIFRKAELGAVLAHMYFQGETPATTTEQLATTMANRMPSAP